MSRIFEGLKVIDCGSFIAAPAATTLLADFGADVIKIEPPGAGDPYRGVPKLPGLPKSEHNYAWLLDNRNKRGLALDLSNPEGQAVLHRLVGKADVFVTNYPLAVRKKLAIGHDTLAELNPRLIYASFTGYGETGEEADKPGFDMTAWWARSGLMDMVRTSADAPPARPVTGMGDHPSALALFGAIAVALYQRERTGRGSHVGSSLIANGLWSNGVMAQAALCGASFTPRPPRERHANALTCYYRCRDGRWLLLTIMNEERAWPVLAKCLGREDLLDDARFARAVRPLCPRRRADRDLRRGLRVEGSLRVALDPQRRRPDLRGGGEPGGDSQRPPDARQRVPRSVRRRHDADHRHSVLRDRRRQGQAAPRAVGRPAQRRRPARSRLRRDGDPGSALAQGGGMNTPLAASI